MSGDSEWHQSEDENDLLMDKDNDEEDRLMLGDFINDNNKNADSTNGKICNNNNQLEQKDNRTKRSRDSSIESQEEDNKKIKKVGINKDNLLVQQSNNEQGHVNNRQLYKVIQRPTASKLVIGPVIFFKAFKPGIEPDRAKLENYLVHFIQQVKMEEIKITANNNVLIYTNSNEDNGKLKACNKNSGKSYNCVNAGFVNAIDKVMS